MKIADCHMHSFFSSDSEAPTEEMVKRAVELGLPAICLTDHYDMDYSTGEFHSLPVFYGLGAASCR